MIVCVPSIRHSGTRLVTKHILSDFVPVNPRQPIPNDGKCHVITGHVTEPSLEYMNHYMQNFPSIVPMRHPASIWKSFADRDMSYDFYFDHWLNLMELYAEYPMAIVHVDRHDRDYYLNEASKFLGVPLSTTWPNDATTGDCGNAEIVVTDLMASKIPSIIMDFYQSTL